MVDKIRFVHGVETVVLENVDPSMTVLEYLRTVARNTGTKEGCAEGDCGACTVAVGEYSDAGVQYRAVNSCILFLPTLDGKHLVTVENLGDSSGDLHAVQEAMVGTHASQCGFCTPGIVMSLAVLKQTHRDPSRELVNEALAGNLCRCTGYVPIVEAALESAGQLFSLSDDSLAERLREIQRTGALSLEADGKKYFAPTTLDELVRIRADNPDSVLLGGGTDVGLWVTKQHRDLDMVIYIGDVPELKSVTKSKRGLSFGAAVTLEEAREPLSAAYPELDEMMARFGSVQVRNSGTLVGNVANASPIGDLNPVMLALGATIEACRWDATKKTVSRRLIEIDNFFLGYRETALEDGEFISAITIPSRDGSLVAAYKIAKRMDQDISAVCGVFKVTITDGTVTAARIAYGGMAATAKRASECEAGLVGNEWSLESVREASRRLEQDFAPIDDMRASATYRMMVAANLMERLYRQSNGEACRVNEVETA